MGQAESDNMGSQRNDQSKLFGEDFRAEARRIYGLLTAEFPEEALSIDDSRGFDLTSVKAQYVIERLNEVLGYGEWNFRGTYERTDRGVIFHGVLRIWVHDRWIEHESIGYSADKKNLGDTYKSARTDCMSKAASYFGVANSVFKGKIRPVKGASKTERRERKPPQDDPLYMGTEDQKPEFSRMAKMQRITDPHIIRIASTYCLRTPMSKVPAKIREFLTRTAQGGPHASEAAT